MKSALKRDDYKMAKCPTCGKEVETPNKKWNLGKIHVRQYECCGKKVPGTHKDDSGVEEVTLHGSVRLV